MMSNMSDRYRWGLLLVIVLSLARPSLADFSRARWAYFKELRPGSDIRADYAEFSLDKEVYSGSRRDLADLRIVNGQEREVPFKLLEERGTVTDTPYAPELLNKSAVPGKYASFMLDLGKPGRVSNRIEIYTSSTNFMQRVDVAGSQDGTQWATLRDDGHIFDFSHEYRARSTTVSYPENTYRYIRVRLWNLDEKPIAIAGANVYWRKVEPAKEMLLYKGKGSVTQNSEERSTDIVVDMRSAGLPGQRAVIASPDTNYNREVEIAGSKDRKEWTELGSGYILKYDMPKLKAEESGVEYSEAGWRYIRVRIRNYDDQPIGVSGVEVYGISRRVFLPYKPGLSYRLYYGNAEAEMPVYDFQQTFKYHLSQPAVTLQLGRESKNPDFSMPIATKPWLEANPWVIWVVLAAGVILLGLLIIRLVLQTKAQPPGESS